MKTIKCVYGKILKYFEKQEAVKVKIFKKVENCKNIKVFRMVLREEKLKIKVKVLGKLIKVKVKVF